MISMVAYNLLEVPDYQTHLTTLTQILLELLIHLMIIGEKIQARVIQIRLLKVHKMIKIPELWIFLIFNLFSSSILDIKMNWKMLMSANQKMNNQFKERALTFILNQFNKDREEIPLPMMLGRHLKPLMSLSNL
jgi:hypothetical protein